MLHTYRILIEASGSRAPLMRRSLLYSLLGSIAQGLAYALLFPLFNALVDSSDDVWSYMGAIAALIVVDALLRLAETREFTRINVEVAHETRENLGEQLKRMPLEQLSRRQTGDLNHVLTGNVNDVVAIAGGTFTIVVNIIVAPAVTVIAMLFIDWRLAAVMAVLFPLALPIYRLIRIQGARDNRIGTAAHAETASHLVEYIQGLPVLRATRQVGARSERLQSALARLREAQVKGLKLGTIPAIGMAAVVQIGIVGITALAVRFALDDSLTAATVLAIVVVTVRFSEPLSFFAQMSVMFDFMQAAVDRIADVLSVEPLPIVTGSGMPAGSEVEFRDVAFAYDQTDELVLRDVSFVVPERSLTALVGTSGSGKTTITRLLTRFADPQHGSVMVGGVDVRGLSQEDLMAQFSVVFQDVYLFDDSIGENIRLAKGDATTEEVIAAARAANCHDFITALPNGYDTGVGEIGGALSGGERQRISIARAILKDAPIVILDEPTSALDTESEVAVQRAIDTLVADKTVVVIAHRLSTIVAADNIMVLEDGQVVEEGDHATLLAGDGRYAEMWRAQRAERHWQIPVS